MNKSISNSDTVIRRVAVKARRYAERYGIYGTGCVDCMCARASYRIFKELLKMGISARFCVSRNHAFVKVNNVIIDVTATQFEIHEFDSHKVLIGKLSELPDIRWMSESIWDEYHGADTLEDVKDLLRDWPPEQQPRNFVKSTKL